MKRPNHRKALFLSVMPLNESHVEEATLSWSRGSGYAVGPARVGDVGTMHATPLPTLLSGEISTIDLGLEAAI